MPARRFVSLAASPPGFRAVYFQAPGIGEEPELGTWDIIPLVAWAAYQDDDDSSVSFVPLVYDSDFKTLVEASEWTGGFEHLLWGIIGPDESQPDITEWRRMRDAHRRATQRVVYEFYLMSDADPDPLLHILPTELMKALQAKGFIIDSPDFIRRIGTIELRKRGYPGGEPQPLGLLATVMVPYDVKREEAIELCRKALLGMGRADIRVSDGRTL